MLAQQEIINLLNVLYFFKVTWFDIDLDLSKVMNENGIALEDFRREQKVFFNFLNCFKSEQFQSATLLEPKMLKEILWFGLELQIL
jgi:hypothetical protein